MRVLHVSEVTWGGVVSLLHDFMAEQLNRGHQVSLLAPDTFPEPNPRLPQLRRTAWSLDRRSPRSYPRALAQLRNTVRRERPDVVHLHSAYAGFLGRLPGMSGTGGAATVYQPHAWSFDLFTDPRIQQAMVRWERLAGRWTDVLATNCGDEIDEGRQIGVTTPGHSLGVPLDVQRFQPVDDAERQRQRRSLGLGEAPTLLCLGRLARQKGQDLLVAAWEQDPIPGTQLLLVGPGDPEPLRRLAPTQWGTSIHWRGDQADVRPCLWASDVLVLPSRYETVAVVVVEAMACGRPVVANRVSGVAMAVADEPPPPGGVVVDSGDMTALLAESARLLADAELRAQYGRDGRARVLSLFTPEQVIDRLDEAYESAMRGSR
ncbi:MAG: glycosyltransferase [Propionibacteriales bacterium]|nr:glycosyltransferase [Propionibacteriales bacterium]